MHNGKLSVLARKGADIMEQPNKETTAAMLEAERIARDPSVKHYSDIDEALRALKVDIQT